MKILAKTYLAMVSCYYPVVSKGIYNNLTILINDSCSHDSEGTNRTGIYSVRMVMDSEAPELVPLEGLFPCES